MSRNHRLLTPERIQFVMLSFEGPDLYASAGGLGVRATELCQTLANQGFRTRLYFLGDPALPPSDQRYRGRLTLHRWSQWLSEHHVGGVYEGEAEKVADYAASLPPHLVEQVIAPCAARKITTVVLAEEWQTAAAVLHLAHLVETAGLSHRCLILWNANNMFGFGHVDFPRLSRAAAVTTVSRYMKHRMWMWGVNPLVVPNGIPKRWLEPVSQRLRNDLRKLFPELLITKVGRYDPDKRWLMAIQAVAELKRRGLRPRLLARGGAEHHRVAVREEARRLGLEWTEVRLSPRAPAREILEELARQSEADVLELCFYVPEDFMRVLYAGSDLVLANSGHEPFGLVGLEVMACGGVVFTGSTGEDYAETFSNCVIVESDDPREIAGYVEALRAHPEAVEEMRTRGKETAARYLWDRVVGDLFRKIKFVGTVRDVVLDRPTTPQSDLSEAFRPD